jgi:molybdopterin-guanine dinucleotide biosynthesis protein
MAVVVVGGHSRSVGKTSVVAGLVRAMPEMRWTAVKITQYGHGICSANGEACDCQTADHRAAISVERDAASGTDTSRYLAAGAERSLWVRTEQGHLAEAMPRLRKELAATENAGGNAIVESNSLMQFLRPDLYLAVLDPANRDFKASALRFLDRADAVLWVGDEEREVEWENVSLKLIRGTPKFRVQAPSFLSDEVVEFVRERMKQATTPAAQR